MTTTPALFRRPTLSGMRPRSGVRPDERPFDWRATVRNPWCHAPGSEARRRAVTAELRKHVTRMRNHPPAKTWTGDHPDAPETGNGPGTPWPHDGDRGRFYFYPHALAATRADDARAVALGCQCHRCDWQRRQEGSKAA